VYLQLFQELPLDPLQYVIPVWGNYDVGGGNCPMWILRSLKYVAPPVVTTAYATDTEVTTVEPTGVVGSATSPTTATTVGVGVTQAITKVNATTPTTTAPPTVIVRTPTTIQPPSTPVQATVTPTPPPPATPAQPPRGSILSLELVLVAVTLIIAVSLIAIYLRVVRR
jgi:hypothetical protein